MCRRIYRIGQKGGVRYGKKKQKINRNGKINCLVVRDLSRFGRDYIETGTYIERIFPQLNIRFISVKEQFDTFATDGSNESLMIPLSNLINDLYSKDISRKVSTALRIHWRTENFTGASCPTVIAGTRIKQKSYPMSEPRRLCATSSNGSWTVFQ